MRRLLLLVALGTIPFAASDARAAETLAQEAAPFTADAYRDAVAWSSYDADTRRYRLRVLRNGRELTLPGLATSARPFDVDLGPLPDLRDGIGAVYSRCEARAASCDIFLLDLQTQRERRVDEVSSTDRDEHDPSLYRNSISFARTAGGGREVVYLRLLGESRSRRQAVPAGRGTVAATELGSATRLAYTWSSIRGEFRTQFLYRVQGNGRLERVARAGSGGLSQGRIVTPSWAGLALYFGRTNSGSGQGNRIYRYAIGRRAYAAAQGKPSYRSVTYVSANRFVTAESLDFDLCTGNGDDPPERSTCLLRRSDPLTFTEVSGAG
jgi:hypothetical protein